MLDKNKEQDTKPTPWHQ